MQPTILVTNGDENGGVHPREKWAAVTTAEIMKLFDIAPGADQAKIGEVRAFERRVLAIATDHHGRVKDFTRQGICDHGKTVEIPAAEGEPAQVVTGQASSSAEPHLQEPLNEIVAAARDYNFGPAIASVEAMEHIRKVLRQHFRTSIEIEHEWHCHRVDGRAHLEHMEKFGEIEGAPAVRFRHRRKFGAQAEG